nr:hypothetical protein [Haladaptatus halobius]
MGQQLVGCLQEFNQLGFYIVVYDPRRNQLREMCVMKAGKNSLVLLVRGCVFPDGNLFGEITE